MSPHPQSLSRLSLAQQIAEIDEPTPADLDPEDEQPGPPDLTGDVVEARDTTSKLGGPSTLRRHLDSIIDPKYVGVKTSRKQLEEHDALGNLPDQDESASQSISSEGSASEEDEGEERVQSPDKEEASEDEQSTQKNNQVIQENSSHEKDLATTVRQRRDEDRKKGRAVTKQLNLWDSLLDARISLQKSVTASNQLPSPTELSEFTFHRRCLEARHALLGESVALVEELSTLRDELINKDKEVQWQPRKRRRLQESSEQGRRYASPEIDNVNRDWDTLIKEASDDAMGLEHAYHAHLTRTLEKWSAKVAAVAPSALLPASRKRFSLAGSTKEGVKSVGTQIEDMFQSGWPALLSRTRRKRSKGPHVTSEEGAGDKGSDEDEVFDDTDFYQQLLRDVIESKGGSGQLMSSQTRKKSKKNVDTRASKGRKLRYEVHEKIQNFMVPVPHHAGWHETQIDELFASLLGKGF
ncbi:apoptosis-antagonizing transcription factor [Russula aff. rugulosa BPL654]|nr:apoptosis-antagonizing transcription factor [Russula aff. rugulosa BPL654]